MGDDVSYLPDWLKTMFGGAAPPLPGILGAYANPLPGPDLGSILNQINSNVSVLPAADNSQSVSLTPWQPVTDGLSGMNGTSIIGSQAPATTPAYGQNKTLPDPTIAQMAVVAPYNMTGSQLTGDWQNATVQAGAQRAAAAAPLILAPELIPGAEGAGAAAEWAGMAKRVAQKTGHALGGILDLLGPDATDGIYKDMLTRQMNDILIRKANGANISAAMQNYLPQK